MDIILPIPEDSPAEENAIFAYHKKYCFCCEKLVNIYLKITQEKLLFFSNEAMTKLKLEIKNDLILAINKHQRNEKDINKFSIFYLKNINSKKIKEIKLKAENRIDTDYWVKKLRKKIKPKKFEFNYNNKNYIEANEIFQFKNDSDFYIALCHLEYILLRDKMIDFFRYYKESRGLYFSRKSTSEERQVLNE